MRFWPVPWASAENVSSQKSRTDTGLFCRVQTPEHFFVQLRAEFSSLFNYRTSAPDKYPLPNRRPRSAQLALKFVL